MITIMERFVIKVEQDEHDNHDSYHDDDDEQVCIIIINNVGVNDIPYDSEYDYYCYNQ